MMFLPESKWSPRYGTQFYTIRMNSYVTLDTPTRSSDNIIFGDDECSLLCNHNTKFPAVYYKIVVIRGNIQHTVLRRYSQFLYLCKKIDNFTERANLHKRHLPPKAGLFHRDSPEFLEERMEGLFKFLMDVLLMPECANNKWVEAFLELSTSEENS